MKTKLAVLVRRVIPLTLVVVTGIALLAGAPNPATATIPKKYPPCQATTTSVTASVSVPVNTPFTIDYTVTSTVDTTQYHCLAYPDQYYPWIGLDDPYSSLPDYFDLEPGLDGAITITAYYEATAVTTGTCLPCTNEYVTIPFHAGNTHKDVDFRVY